MANLGTSVDTSRRLNELFKPPLIKVSGVSEKTVKSTLPSNSWNNYADAIGGLTASYGSRFINAINPFSIIGNELLSSDSSGEKTAGVILNNIGSNINTNVIKGIGTGVANSVSLATGFKNISKAIGEGTVSGLKSGLKDSLASLGNWLNVAGLGIGVADALLGQKSEYGGKKGYVTKRLDQAYNIAQTGVNFLPGGQAISLAMAGLNTLGKGLGKLGGGTDGMTTLDAILGSGFFNWNVGLINGFGGKTTDSYFNNRDLNAASASGYSGFLLYNQRAADVQNKKYGLLSKGAYKDALSTIRAAQRMLDIINTTVDFNTLNNLAAQGSTSQLANQYSNDLSGGIGQIRAAKSGMKFNDNRRLISELSVKDRILKAKFGKMVNRADVPYVDPNIKKHFDDFDNEFYDEFYEDEEGFNDGGGFSSGEGLGLPEEVNYGKRLQQAPYIHNELLLKDKEFLNSVQLEKPNFKTFIDNIMSKDSNKEPSLFYSLPIFQKGGQMNVIPEGALHARLHHLDLIDEKFKDVTNKGIPVITEEKDGEVVQHAEIEHSEIIYTLDVSEKLEELRKKFNETNKDEYAIEAGKLLVEETLHNTDDRNNVIENIE